MTVPNSEPVDINMPKLAMVLEKNSPAKLSNKQVNVGSGSAKVNLPDLTAVAGFMTSGAEAVTMIVSF